MRHEERTDPVPLHDSYPKQQTLQNFTETFIARIILTDRLKTAYGT